MQFALLIYESPQAFASRKSDGTNAYTGAWRAYHKALAESGAYVAGDPLQPTSTATTVRVSDGRSKVLNGPYAETKEQLGGYYIIDVADLDAALTWAARCPGAQSGVLEVRPIWSM